MELLETSTPNSTNHSQRHDSIVLNCRVLTCSIAGIGIFHSFFFFLILTISILVWEVKLLSKLGYQWISSMASNRSSTCFIEGRCLGSGFRHFRVSFAVSKAALVEYWPFILPSIMLFNFFLEERHGFLHSTRFCCSVGLLLSITLMPVSISRSTTPNPYTSLFTYKSPVQIFIQFKHMLVCGGSKHWTPLFLITFLTSFPQIHSLLYYYNIKVCSF